MNSRRYPYYERQWRKFMFSFFDYMPMKKRNATDEEWKVRKLIWAFKDGKAFQEVAKLVADKIVNLYGAAAKDIVFACIPASSAEKNERRYRQFSELVCQLSGANNAYQHIEVEGERLAIHEMKGAKKIQNVEVINFDKEFFKGKKVLIFDDILTRGFSYARFANQIEKFGADVLGGLFIGKTALIQ